MKKEIIFITSLAILAAVLFGWGSKAGFALQSFLRGTLASSAGPGGNADLTASLASILRGNAADVSGSGGEVAAPVYSRYPLNLKNEISIAAGRAEGVSEGDVALAGGYFIGTVRDVAEHSAVVRTIFDSGFQAPVRIGSSGTDALLKGGNDPALELIAALAAVGEGDEVYTAVKGVPYGLPLGTLHGLHDSADKVFREATLSVPYAPGGLKELTIIPKT